MAKLRHAARTHVGKVRKNNEDDYALNAEQGVFVLCDGMGGHEGGEVASRLAVTTVLDFFKNAQSKPDEKTWPFGFDSGVAFRANCLSTGILLANQRILDAIVENPKLEKMGTTIVSLVFDERKGWFAHVGDSRGYLFSAGKLRQVTADHSWVGEQVRMGIITAEEAEHHAFRNVITRSLGMADPPKVDITPVEPQSGDVFLLCSDGLSGMVTDIGIEELIRAHHDDLEKCAELLIEAALEGGGKDNVTVILVEYLGE
jgi:protein phosphatase